MRISYIRFVEAVGSPGHAGSNIKKAKLRTKETEVSTPRDELMDEITIEDGFVVLRVFRTIPGRKRPVLAERLTPIANCIDFEPVADVEPEKKGPAT